MPRDEVENDLEVRVRRGMMARLYTLKPESRFCPGQEPDISGDSRLRDFQGE
jgi:hypothetical protein